MAESSKCSVCSKPAHFFCLCTSVQTLLCEGCVPQHIITKAAHLMSPLAAVSIVKKAEDLGRYNMRLQVVDSLTRTLTAVSERLELEEQSMKKQVALEQDKQVKAVHEAFTSVQADLEAVYSSLKATVKVVLSELEEASIVSVVQLSEAAQLFVSAAEHLKDKAEPFLDVQQELSRRVSLALVPASLAPGHAFEAVLQPHICSLPTCVPCQDVRKGLELQVVLEETGILRKLFGKSTRSIPSETPTKRRKLDSTMGEEKPKEASATYT